MEYRSAALGILYAEDFSDPVPVAAPEMEAPPPAPPPRDLDAEIDRAVAAARAAWAEADGVRRTAALETMAAGLAELKAEAARRAEEVAEALAGAALSAVSALLPRLAASHGPAEVRDLVARLLPPLCRAEPVVVRVHPSLIAALEADIAGMGEELAGRVELRPANLAAGDARLDWPDGSLMRDTRAIQAAIHDGFAQLGLLMPEKEIEHV